jgi:hypothetical protein
MSRESIRYLRRSFHRLKLEDVIPNPELKVQIEAWVAEGKIGRTTVDVDM